ncbi:MAG: hypothetical protein ABI649_01390 [Gaiellaceae bacterium]
MDLGTIFTLLFLLLFVVPVITHRLLDMRCARAIISLQRSRGTRVIAMIHRQETVGFLGLPSSEWTTARSCWPMWRRKRSAA